jgi:uncharacterized membrane protein SpoIIM required for sporulation
VPACLALKVAGVRQATFVERRQAGWDRLEQLLRTAERRGLRRLEPDEVSELGTLYRWVTSDLAAAQSRNYDPTLVAYLNRLTARAHAAVYAEAGEGGFARVLRFYARTFPMEVKNSRWPILLSVALFLCSAGVAYYLIHSQPLDAYVLLPGPLLAPVHKGLHASNFEPMRKLIGSPTMSATIMTNNIRVAFLAFAGGVTLGVVTVYLLLFNGLMLGGTAALYANAGFARDFWATVAPHGIIELTAVQISAGAGLLIAAGVLAPGQLRRRDALKRNARRAGILVIGVASMLVVAATIEGFFSPQNFPEGVRLAFGGITAVAMILYYLAGTRPLPRALRSDVKASSAP